MPIFPMSWKSAAVARAPSCLAGSRSSRPIARETRRTRWEWPAVYGSRASTAAFSVSIGLEQRRLELARRLREIVRARREIFVLRAKSCRRAADEQRENEPEDAEHEPDREPDRAPRVVDDLGRRRSRRVTPPRLLPTAPRDECSGAHTLTTDGAPPIGSTIVGRRRAALDRLPEPRARPATADTLGMRRREGKSSVARVDVQRTHVVRQPDRPSRRRIVARSANDLVPAHEGRCENRVRVGGHVERVVVQRCVAQVARERRRERDGTDDENRRRGDQERPEQRQRTQQPGRAVGPHPPHAPCIGSHKVLVECPSRLIAVELDVVFLGTSGSMPTAKRAPSCDARAPRRRSAPLRLRGGDAAPAPAQRCRPCRARGDLPHALPRRPLPRPSGHAQDLRAPRSRGPAHDLRPEGSPGALATLGRIFGRLTYPVSTVVLEPDARLERDGYAIEPFEVDHRVTAIGYALVEDERPGRFDVDEADPSRRAGRTRTWASPEGRDRDARRRTRDHAR